MAMVYSADDQYKFNDGREIPCIGFGVWDNTFSQDIYSQVRTALEVGYRHIDTAAYYRNEGSVGDAIKDSGVPREDLFITTKLWPKDFADAKSAFAESMRKLRLDYLDLYLLHWPGIDEDLMLKTWERLIAWREEGRVLSIGGSNFMEPHIKSVDSHTGVPIACNQIQLHPWHQQRELVSFCRDAGIAVTAWGPIFHGHLSEEPLPAEIGERYGKSGAQVTLRWHVQHGNIIIPKSSKRERIIANRNIYDFELTPDDMAAIDALDGKGDLGFDPMTFAG
jgi:diketogulonate reductase-like aldo/keto reductase